MPDMRNFDELESGFMKVFLELLVAVEVAIGLLDNDVPAEQQPLENKLNIEGRELGGFRT
jgi:hypothetical protein